MANYALEGQKWGGSAFGTSGGVVSWAVDSSVPASFVSTIGAAFSSWSAVANITFMQVTSLASSVIDVVFGAIDGSNKTLGIANYSYSGSSLLSATITFDSAEGWHSSGGTIVSNGGTSFLVVATHEIGHAVGLDHYEAQPAVMNPILGSSITGLTTSDIDGARAIYGAAPGSLLASDALVDDAFYFAANPDVAASGLDPDSHYAAFGWREGREPNAHFSTKGYLSANSDVARAGVNPLSHYDQFGWREGRDPSAAFDNELYLSRNSDVRAAGIDPLAHYLQSGQSEGRQIGPAIGTKSDVAANSFDREFYLLSNPDVGQAGMDALQHFNQFGAREGRDPNAFFNTKGYLAAYGDVAASGMNPLTHYDQFGWKESRDPSGRFDSSSYLAANTDVAASNINPLTHYLEFGMYEGRSAFADGSFVI
jgi:hypothetical protein